MRRRSAPKCYRFVVIDNDINKNYVIFMQFIAKKGNVHYFGRKENIVKQMTTFCFFSGVEIHGRQYFHKRTIEMLYQEKGAHESFLHQFMEKVQYNMNRIIHGVSS
jgi:hypothetical protein